MDKSIPTARRILGKSLRIEQRLVLRHGWDLHNELVTKLETEWEVLYPGPDMVFQLAKWLCDLHS